MAFAEYSSFQYISDGIVNNIFWMTNISVNDVAIAPNVYQMTFDDAFSDGPQITNVSFLGYTDRGEPVFDFGGGEYVLTNQPYADGAPSPTYTPASVFVACFLAGTLISTPQGATPVEALAADDLVTTADGGVAKVKWIGRQTVATLFAQSEDRAPICVAAGALGANLPERDLKLTADHALLLDGVLVQAGALVNGSTIRRMTAAETGERYTVWHVETEGHEIILAEGCAAETFVDTVSRRRFDNYAEYLSLFGEETSGAPELDLPRVKSARQLPPGVRALVAVKQAA